MTTLNAPTRFFMVRHALVAPEYMAVLYGQMDVPICPAKRVTDDGRYAALAALLPHGARWLVTPLSRTRATAEAIMASGYGSVDVQEEAGLIEQDFGEWQGLPMHQFVNRPAQHSFWPVGGEETPPGGECFGQMRARVGMTIERLARDHRGETIVAISHGGAIRAAVAAALDLTSDQALSLAVDNLSVTRLERHERAWRVVSVNEQISI